MKLRSLRLHGFKSFADRTEIQFHEGITSIVGPNGCGKSNIGDAIRWVLGEQRPSAIRGARMEEAIFQGTVNRRPVNRGSVSMVVSNEDRTLPVPFEEVEIGRTVYRDGGSEYSLNRAACRLRDVHDLCRDTGLGANAYSVIEARMIDAILSDRAEERRSLFEEAAGIGRYKDRRGAAQRRLDRADQDLQRLEDLIGEVESKVRSLARQKGRAERFHRLRARRLAVEVAVVRDELAFLNHRVGQLEQNLTKDQANEEGMVAQLRAAEARYESIRLRQVEAERIRSSAASHLEHIRTDLARWERDLAVAEERAGYARRRLDQIRDERASRESRVQALDENSLDSSSLLRTMEEDLRRASEEVEAALTRAGVLRERLEEARESVASLEIREREIVRKLAQLSGDAEGAEAQAMELGRRLVRLEREAHDIAADLLAIQAQGDLFQDRAGTLEREVVSAEAGVAVAKEELATARDALERARTAEREASATATAVAAQLEALEGMERSGEGVLPVVRAALETGDPGIIGTLSDFVSASGKATRAVEAHLGPLLQGLVVRDGETVARVRRWFHGAWKGGGGLILMALDAVPSVALSGSLLGSVELRGEGAPWVEALLAGVDLVADDDQVFLSPPAPGPRISATGTSVDRLGIVRVGAPGGSTGVLLRREKIRDLRREAEKADSLAQAARNARSEAERAVSERETRLEEAWIQSRQALDRHREARAEIVVQDERRVRVDRQSEELDRQIEGTRSAQARAQERAQAARVERETLLDQEERLRVEHDGARRELERALQEWETIRDEEAGASIRLARLEGDVVRVAERQAELSRARAAEAERLQALNEEEQELLVELEEATKLRSEGASATEDLFRSRDRAQAELAERERAVEELVEELTQAEADLRSIRSAEREATDTRHRLQLERQELVGRIDRIRARLEGEWDRPLETLLEEAGEVEGDPEELRQEYQQIVQDLERLGPVNLLAVEEHEEESARLAFLREQRDDLVEARDDLRSAIREINRTATRLFEETFEKIRQNFQSTFVRLFQGGEADLWLSDPDQPLEAPIEIHASPRGKRTQRIDLLSGGERALTALALLFGIYLVKPSPFCVLDEVDAPLDESNIERFTRLLQEFKAQTQFVVITHNPRTIEAADWIYGVTMEEAGVSTVVGVRLEEAMQASGSAA